MPIVRITWFAGRDQGAKEKVARGVEELMREAGAPPGSTYVLFEDVARENWAIDGKTGVLSSPKYRDENP
jgi:4-oxalocrotonate tautomerase